MTNNTQIESHHGVLMRIDGYGVFIIGSAGIGKSSLALELIAQGQQLIADDVVEFSEHSNSIMGHCPPMLEGLLHTRELGLISISTVFGQTAWKRQQSLDFVILLQSSFTADIELTKTENDYPILGQIFPLLTLSTHNPASLVHRIQCWLAMLNKQHRPEIKLKLRQQESMSDIKYREIS